MSPTGPAAGAGPDDPELVDVFGRDQITAWQDYHLSGMGQMISAMNLCYVLIAAANTGMVQRLRESDQLTAEALLAGLDEHLGAGILRYLQVRGVLEEWQGSYALSRHGELLTNPVSMARLGFYVEAYGPVTGRLAELLDGSLRYGTDIVRAGGALSRHSGTVAVTSYADVVLRSLDDGSDPRVLDLGCGDGSLLIRLCVERPDVHGIGIDIVPDAIEAAQQRARDAGVDDRLSFHVADAFQPGTWPAETAAATVITSIGVLHERFRDGEAAVVEILDTYAGHLAEHQSLLLGEPELLFDDRENDSDFFLVHVLTAQGIPRARSEWLRIIGETQLRCVRLYANAIAGPRTCFYELKRRAS